MICRVPSGSGDHILQVDTINAPIGLYSDSQYSDHIQYSVPNIVDD